MRRLSRSVLPELPPSVRQPQYDRESLKIGMAHIGVGAFHRCHQAEFIDDMLEARFGRWGVVGVNLTAPSLADLLAPQDCLYSRTLRQDARAETRIIGALRQVIDVADKASAEVAIAALGGPDISVATITVTEKGYCLTPSTGALELDNPALRADIEGGFPPRTLLGLLALALERRRQTGGAPLTLISCDNVPSNGARLGAAMLKFAALRSAELTRFIEERVTFPSTMVDRIVPATAPEDIDKVSEALGARDSGAVVGEPFRQWVIEDKFAGERPPLDLAGATFVADAKPYEQIKMRVLNAAQSTLAHQGALVGHEFTYQAAADPMLAALTRRTLEQETSTHAAEVRGNGDCSVYRSVDGAHPQHRHPSSLSSDRHGWIAKDCPASRRSITRASRGRPAAGLAHSRGRQLDRLWFERRASLRRPLDAVGSLRGERHRNRGKKFRLDRTRESCALPSFCLWL